MGSPQYRQVDIWDSPSWSRHPLSDKCFALRSHEECLLYAVAGTGLKSSVTVDGKYVLPLGPDVVALPSTRCPKALLKPWRDLLLDK